ncbi:MAG: hypothetical protein ABIF77_21650, partial [bacterium]
MQSWPHSLRRFLFVCLLSIGIGTGAGIPPALANFDWQRSEGPWGGMIFALAEAPNGDLYAGSWRYGGIFRSTDVGASWNLSGLWGARVPDIIVDNAGRIFASVDNGDVQRSTDNGTSWPLLGSSLTGPNGGLAYDDVLDILYAARPGTVSRSTNGGDSWQAVSTNFPSLEVRALAAVPNGGPLFVGTGSDKAYRSEDGGVTWNLFDSGLGANRCDDFLIVPEGDIYVATYGAGIYRTEWAGSSWTQLSQGLTNLFCYSIERDGAGRLWAGTAEKGPFVSVDDGLNWSPA